MMTFANCGTFQVFVILLALTVVTDLPAQTIGRMPIPTKEQQEASAKVLEEGYQVSKATTPPKKQQLVKDLMKVAGDLNLPKGDLYVVLTTVISLAQELRDLPKMSEAVELVIQSFEVDPFAERARHLIRYLELFNASAKATTLKPVFDEVAALVRPAAAERRYADAEKLLDDVDAVLTKLKVPGSSKQQFSDLRKEITAQKEIFEVLQLARSVLETKPDNPDANFTIGRWLVTEETNWKLALPHLAKSSNSKPWQDAATLELSPNAVPVKVGDAWWELAQSESQPAKLELLLHAGEWYQQALPKLTTLEKKLIDKRLADIAALPKAGANVARTSKSEAGSNAIGPKLQIGANGWQQIETGKSVSLLERVKIPDHVLQGKWKQKDGGLVCEPAADALAFVPVAIDGGYELDMEFTRRSGTDHVFLTFPVGPSACSILFGVNSRGNIAHGLWHVDKKDPYGLPASARVGVVKSRLDNGQRYKVHLEVAVNGEKVIISATINGAHIVESKGFASQLSSHASFPRPNAQLLLLGALNSATDFHSLSLKLKSRSSGYFVADDFLCPATAVADKPPKNVDPKLLQQWNGKTYFVSDKPMSFVDAQQLATRLQGRLLTISTAEENKAVIENGRGLFYWMAGWRSSESNQWRDERNRPLRFMASWAANQPNNRFQERILGINTPTNADRGWHDCEPWYQLHAVIEWGEEYPNDK